MNQRTAIITGGAKGIGREISETLATQGWNLILIGREQQALDLTASEIQSKNKVVVKTLSLDLSAPNAIENLFSSLDPNRLPQALICNASNFGVAGPLAKVDFQAWKKSFDFNFFSIAEMIQRYVQMSNSHPTSYRRKIIVMSGNGLGGSKVLSGTTSYGCAKAALYRLVEHVHEEVFNLGIDINCVAPGAVKTGMTDQAENAGPDLGGASYIDALKIKQSGGDSPSLAAKTIATLLSPACDKLSGRLVSSKWDKRLLENVAAVIPDQDLMRLRRIDNELFTKGKA